MWRQQPSQQRPYRWVKDRGMACIMHTHLGLPAALASRHVALRLARGRGARRLLGAPVAARPLGLHPGIPPVVRHMEWQIGQCGRLGIITTRPRCTAGCSRKPLCACLCRRFARRFQSGFGLTQTRTGRAQTQKKKMAWGKTAARHREQSLTSESSSVWGPTAPTG